MKYKPLNNFYVEGTGFISSIFENGMCISTPGPVSISDILHADFTLPGLDSNVVSDLRVVWVKDALVGLEFIDRQARMGEGDQDRNGGELSASLSDYIRTFSDRDLQPCYRSIQNHFTYRLAESEMDREKIYRLRYLIYVLEHPWEPANEFGLERDEYDDQAVHFMVQDKNNAVIAASRILRPGGGRTLPIERHFPVDLASGPFPPEEVCEISRYCVAREYRRHIEEADCPPSGSGAQAGRNRLKYRSPSLLMNFFKIMYQYSMDHGIRGWYMVIESRLANTLRGAGFDLTKVGEPRNYHGLRTPYLLDLEKIEREVADINPALSACLNQR
jgi:N-acyl amino acid synthase of PEP-CTERM/exosortase system